MRQVQIVSCMLILLGTSFVHADEMLDQQRSTVKTNIDAARIKSTSRETDSLIVYATFPQATTDSLAKNLESTYTAATKQLDFAIDEKPFKGKLTVIVLSDARDFKNYILRVERKAPPRNESQYLSLESDTPTVIVGVALGSRIDEKALLNDAGIWVGAAVLQAKMGTKTNIPTWLKQAYGTMIDLHRPGNERALSTHRSTVTTLYKRSNGKLFTSWQMSVESLGDYSNIIHTSALESIAYGTLKESFLPFVQSFRPSENGEAQSVDDGVRAIGLEWKDFDAAWRKWVVTGK